MSSSVQERISRTVVDNARSTAALLRDSGYATIGVTDAAVAYVRDVGTRATEARGALRSVKLPRAKDVSESLRDLGENVEEQFESLADRGRAVVESLQDSPATRSAAARARVAKTQVQGAATSVQRAGAAAVDAAEDAADTIGDGSRDEYAAMTVEELRAIARTRDIEGRSDMNKAELVEALADS